MFVAPDSNVKVYGPAGNNYGRDMWLPDYWFRPNIRKRKINKIFNDVGKEIK